MGNLGYTCGCGKFHKADMWSCAHWNERLIHECDCGNRNAIKSGKVEKVYRKDSKSTAVLDKEE